MYTIQYMLGILNNKMIMIFSTLKQFLDICHSKNDNQICLLFVLEGIIDILNICDSKVAN